MDALTIYEIMSWVQTNDLKVVVAGNVSNIILLSYLVAYGGKKRK